MSRLFQQFSSVANSVGYREKIDYYDRNLGKGDIILGYEPRPFDSFLSTLVPEEKEFIILRARFLSYARHDNRLSPNVSRVLIDKINYFYLDKRKLVNCFKESRKLWMNYERFHRVFIYKK